jgi:bacteriocin biosynthesis cyclodehydratase domain-containing protein
VRIQLLPGLHRAWRGPNALQLGIGPGRATVVEGLSPRDAALLDRLVTGVDPAELTAADARDRAVVDLLRDAGALVPSRAGRAAHTLLEHRRDTLAPDAAVWALVHRGHGDGWDLLAARDARCVLVVGSGRVADALGGALEEAGVGSVERRPDLTPHALRARTGGGRGSRPDCVVLVEAAAADSARADDLLRRDMPHLSVVVREGDVVVGPLVRPGDGPCLRCLDLHRAERDPAWPVVLAQLLLGGGQAPEESVTAALAGGLGALQVLGQLDGVRTPAAAGATLEVALPDGLVTRRPWPPAPGCGCTRLSGPDEVAAAAPGDGARPAPPGWTMGR